MRCIEMELNTPELPQDETINRNMRCIEIAYRPAFSAGDGD